MFCPSEYCGRPSLNITSILECRACTWGSRPDTDTSICRLCDEPLDINGWMYLLFMSLTSLVLHFMSIDANINVKSRREVLLYVCVTVEACLSAIISVLISAPVGRFRLNGCLPKILKDWYPVFFNPTINYSIGLSCTQEMVYPLYTIVLIYYALQLPLMIIFRPIVHKLISKPGLVLSKTVYCALYFLPILALCHIMLAGIIYYIFPYITAVLSMTSLVSHLTSIDQIVVQETSLVNADSHTWFTKMIKACCTKPRNLAIISLHFLFHGLAILMFTGFSDARITLSMLLLIPLPMMIFILTAKLTDPRNSSDLESRMAASNNRCLRQLRHCASHVRYCCS